MLLIERQARVEAAAKPEPQERSRRLLKEVGVG